ncbi:DUF6884 domain-containing protein [Halosimplex salinum]|uniref:DUF6884 domain-containing protein n=1 Tax=Halosimplex salinum TaxID=1710538 RepID=UPI0013DD8AAC|nr:DUF6884 domain-containing protein [Halosimplex salinum]
MTAIPIRPVGVITRIVNTLLVQSCSERKVDTPEPIPAFERYDGYFYRIIKNALDSPLNGAPFDIRILSAEYGLLHPDDPIENYDRKMDEQRAAELRPTLTTELRELAENSEYEQIVVNAGKTYWEAIDGFQNGLDAELVLVDGEGLGEKGHFLKEFLQSLQSDTELPQAQ